MAKVFVSIFVLLAAAHGIFAQVLSAAALCPCLVPVQGAAPVGAGAYAASPYDAGSQALSIDPFGLAAAQAASRRQNMNAQSQIGQYGGNNMNAQSQIGQIGRRQNMNAQSGVNQVGRRQNMNAQSGVSQVGRRQNMNAQSGVSQQGGYPVAYEPAAAYAAPAYYPGAAAVAY